MSRILSFIVRAARMLPKQLDRLHLEWARDSLTKRDPTHPDLPWIVLRIRELSK